MNELGGEKLEAPVTFLEVRTVCDGREAQRGEREPASQIGTCQFETSVDGH